MRTWDRSPGRTERRRGSASTPATSSSCGSMRGARATFPCTRPCKSTLAAAGTWRPFAALEALRAHLLQIRSEPPPAPTTPSPPPDAPASNPPPAPLPSAASVGRPKLWLHVAAGVDASPGGIPPSVEALLEVRLEPVRWLSLAAFGAGTPAGAELDAPEGKATVHRILAGGAIDVQKHVARVSLAVGAGCALVPTFVQGAAPAAGYAARDTSSLTVAPLLRTSLSIAIAPVLRVRLAPRGRSDVPEIDGDVRRS